MSIRDTSAQDRPVSAATAAGQHARKRRQQLLAAGIGVAVLLLAAWLVVGWAAGSRSFDGDRVRIAQVTRGDLVRDITADGRVIAANSPTLYAIAGGTVTLHVVAGDRVEKGQALAEIDSPELRSRLAQEEATLASVEAEATRAGLDAELARSSARRELDQAQIQRQAAARDLERNARAYEGGAVAQVDVARAEDTLKSAEIGLQHARQDFELQGKGAGLDIRNKKLLADRQRAVVGELQRQVDALTLRAPFDGQVGQVQVEQRANVAINAPVLGVVDLSRFEVEIKVPESFARDLAIGMPAQLTSVGKQFAGEVSAVSPEVVNGEVTASASRTSNRRACARTSGCPRGSCSTPAATYSWSTAARSWSRAAAPAPMSWTATARSSVRSAPEPAAWVRSRSWKAWRRATASWSPAATCSAMPNA